MQANRVLTLAVFCIMILAPHVSSSPEMLRSSIGYSKQTNTCTLMARGKYKQKLKAQEEIQVQETGIPGMIKRMKVQGEKNKKMLENYLKGVIAPFICCTAPFCALIPGCMQIKG